MTSGSRPDDLFEPAAEDFGFRGHFERQAKTPVHSFRPDQLRAGLAIVGVVVAAGLGALASMAVRRLK